MKIQKKKGEELTKKSALEQHKMLYQMICSLKGEDLQKAISYVSFLRFVDVYKDKAMADLLKIELSENSQANPFLPDATPAPLPLEPVQPERQEEPVDAVLELSPPAKPKRTGRGPEDPDAEELIEPVHIAPGQPARVNTLEEELLRAEEFKAKLLKANAAAEIPVTEPFQAETPKLNILEEELRRAEAFKAELLKFDSPRAEPGREIHEDAALAPIPEENTPAALSSAEPSPPEPASAGLRRIIKVLHLDFDDLAFVFQVSASRVARWFEEPSLEGVEEMQLRSCLDIAERVEEMDIPRFDLIARRPLPDGEFFLEKLKGRRVTGEHLRTLEESAKKAEEQRRLPKGAAKRIHAIQNTVDLYATPLRHEVR